MVHSGVARATTPEAQFNFEVGVRPGYSMCTNGRDSA